MSQEKKKKGSLSWTGDTKEQIKKNRQSQRSFDNREYCFDWDICTHIIAVGANSRREP
jgi:hypothetical protein